MLQVLIDISLKSFVAEKRHGAMQNLFKKKEKKREKHSWEKNGHKSVRDIENNGYLDAHLKKRQEEEIWIKIALVLLHDYFQVSKER